MDVGFDRLVAYPEPSGNGAIRSAFGHQAQHLVLSLAIDGQGSHGARGQLIRQGDAPACIVGVPARFARGIPDHQRSVTQSVGDETPDGRRLIAVSQAR